MTTIDLAVLAIYVALVLMIGWRCASPETGVPSAREWMLADRSLPVWAVIASMVATELSAATFIGVPERAYAGDWSLLQLAIGMLIGKGILSFTVIPAYHAAGVTTVYEYVGTRFGRATHRLSALCFIGGRLLASGVRLYIAALAVSVVTGWPIAPAIAISGVIALVYTMFGGIRAVVWTDTLQGAVLLVAGVATLGVIAWHSRDSLAALPDWIVRHGKCRVVHTDPWFSLTESSALLVGSIGGVFLTLATHGTDHDMVQRLLTTRDGRSGGRALWRSAWLSLAVTALFLAVGTGLAYYYRHAPGYDISDRKRILPIFLLREMPTGLRGLCFAGLFAAAMSSLDSAICALTTVWSNDIAGQPRHSVRRAAVSTRVRSLVFAVLLIGAAIGLSEYDAAMRARDHASLFDLVSLSLSSMTILYGGLLGLFAAAIGMPSRGTPRTAILGLGCGIVVGLALFLQKLYLPAGVSPIAWPWWIAISGTVTFALVTSRRATDTEGPACARRADQS